MTTQSAWDTYAHQKPGRRAVNAAGETTWFNWTQYPDHGPGAELLGLGPGAAVLDLGCGKGGNLAHLATLGVRAVGVDVSPAQLRAAAERWPTAALELHHGDAGAFLAEHPETFDAVFSVFGAVWFTDPADLLPVVRKALRPGGVLAFSHRPPVPGCYGCQASYVTQGDEERDPLVVKRWDHTPERWVELLDEHGFNGPTASVLPAPPGPRTIGTLLVRGVAGRREGDSELAARARELLPPCSR